MLAWNYQHDQQGYAVFSFSICFHDNLDFKLFVDKIGDYVLFFPKIIILQENKY